MAVEFNTVVEEMFGNINKEFELADICIPCSRSLGVECISIGSGNICSCLVAVRTDHIAIYIRTVNTRSNIAAIEKNIVNL